MAFLVAGSQATKFLAQHRQQPVDGGNGDIEDALSLFGVIMRSPQRSPFPECSARDRLLCAP